MTDPEVVPLSPEEALRALDTAWEELTDPGVTLSQEVHAVVSIALFRGRRALRALLSHPRPMCGHPEGHAEGYWDGGGRHHPARPPKPSDLDVERLARAIAAWWVADRPLIPFGAAMESWEVHLDDARLIAEKYAEDAR